MKISAIINFRNSLIRLGQFVHSMMSILQSNSYTNEITNSSVWF